MLVACERAYSCWDIAGADLSGEHTPRMEETVDTCASSINIGGDSYAKREPFRSHFNTGGLRQWLTDPVWRGEQ